MTSFLSDPLFPHHLDAKWLKIANLWKRSLQNVTFLSKYLKNFRSTFLSNKFDFVFDEMNFFNSLSFEHNLQENRCFRRETLRPYSYRNLSNYYSFRNLSNYLKARRNFSGTTPSWSVCRCCSPLLIFVRLTTLWPLRLWWWTEAGEGELRTSSMRLLTSSKTCARLSSYRFPFYCFSICLIYDHKLFLFFTVKRK